MYDDCAVKDGENFKILCVSRIRKKGTPGYIEYKEPVSLVDRESSIQVIGNLYEGDRSALKRWCLFLTFLTKVITVLHLDYSEENETYSIHQQDEEHVLESIRPRPRVRNIHRDHDDRERVAAEHGVDERGMIRAVIAPQNDSYDNGIRCSSRTRVQRYCTS